MSFAIFNPPCNIELRESLSQIDNISAFTNTLRNAWQGFLDDSLPDFCSDNEELLIQLSKEEAGDGDESNNEGNEMKLHQLAANDFIKVSERGDQACH